MDALAVIGIYILAAAGTLGIGLLARWYDRKLTAMVQYRKGPPWYQPVADVVKLFYKETLMPSTARATGFLLAPAVALAGVVLAAAILWAALIRPQTGFVGDLIVVIYLLIIPPVATIVGAGASGSPHASIGASREMKLILSYELPLFLALLVGVIHAGWTLELGAMSAASALYSISGVLAMLVALVSVQAKLGQVPFDVAEAECEIMTGVFVEYSGAALALIYLARAAMLATLPLLLIAVFWGGLHGGWGILPFIGKYLLLVTLVTLIRNTNPRLRIDQAVKLFWWALTPIAILAVVLAFLGYSWNKAWL